MNLIAKAWEFALVAKDGTPCDLADSGRIRIITRDEGIERVEIKACGESEWRELQDGLDLVLFEQIVARYKRPPPTVAK